MAEGKYTFRVHDRAHKLQIAQAVEEIFDVHVKAVRTSKVKSKPKRRGLQQRPVSLLEEGDRPARPGRADRAVRGRGGGGLTWLMANRKTRPTSPGRRFGTYPLREELTGRRADEEADQGQEALRRAQHRGPDHRAPPRRRRQAPLPADRLQAHQGRGSREGRDHRVRPEPLRQHRAAQLRGRREALHPRSAGPRGRRAEVVSGEGADIAPGNSLPLARIPTGTVVHNVELIPGPGRPASAGPPGPRSRWSPRRGRW